MFDFLLTSESLQDKIKAPALQQWCWWSPGIPVFFLCICPCSGTSRSPRVTRGGCQRPHSHSSRVWTEAAVRVGNQTPSKQFCLAPGLGAPHALCGYKCTLNCPSKLLTFSCKTLKICFSLAQSLCHITQDKVQVVPRWQVDAADQFISWCYSGVCQCRLKPSLCFPLKAYEHSTQVSQKSFLYQNITSFMELEDSWGWKRAQGVSSPTSAQAGFILRSDWVTRGSVYLGLENLQGWRLLNLSWQPFRGIIMSNAGFLRRFQVQFSLAVPKTLLSLPSL